MFRAFAIMVVLAAAMLPTSPALAIDYEYPASCYNCENVALWTDDCVEPQNNGIGTGINCRISTIYIRTVCMTSGGACSYHCTGDCGGPGDGGGGGGGGGDGDTCSGAGGFCPAECFSCGGYYY